MIGRGSSKRRTTIALLLTVLLLASDVLFFCTAQSSSNTTAPNNSTTSSSSSSYEVYIDGIFINDVITKTDDIAVIHTDRQFDIIAKLVWSNDYYDSNSSNEIEWVAYVNDARVDGGILPLVEHYSLPATLFAGSAALDGGGRYDIKVVVELDAIAAEFTREYICFDARHSLWPLVIIIIFAITTGMVSVFVCLFVCCCMIMIYTSFCYIILLFFLYYCPGIHCIIWCKSNIYNMPPPFLLCNLPFDE